MVEHVQRGFLPLSARSSSWGRVSTLAAAAAVAAQITYPLLSGVALAAVTVLTVVLFATASVTHAATAVGLPIAFRVLLVTGAASLVTEIVGLRTGYPFGSYAYATSLGVTIGGVPVVVPLAWMMMTYPALLVARRLVASVTRAAARGTRRTLWVAVLGGVTLTAWDLFLDPQMVDGGFWAWRHPDPGLPGVDGVPLTNLAGWMLVGTVLITVVDRMLPCPVSASDPASTSCPAPTTRPASLTSPARTTPAAPPTPAVLLAWTWLGSTLANLTFFGRPMLAGYGFLALGATVAPYLLLVVRDARRDGVCCGAGRITR